MKFTLSALRSYLHTTQTTKQICEALTKIGLEVESCQEFGADLAQFSVAKILEAQLHPNSSKLKICKVQTKDSADPLQIVCGAANARAGIKVAYAKIGSVIPANQMQIKQAKIAGVESNGMLCSAEELLIFDKTNQDGIIEIADEIDDEIEIGTNLNELFGNNETVIEINVTPNRGDCLGVFGIARDLAALGIGVLKKPEIAAIAGSFPFDIPNLIEDTKLFNFSKPKKSVVEPEFNSGETTTLKTKFDRRSNLIKCIQNFSQQEGVKKCPIGCFRLIRGIKNQESPKWLSQYLAAIGINSISAVVDVLNYVMHQLNRPMHAYDASKIKGEMAIRFANDGEKFYSLKNEEILLDPSILVIADQNKLLAIAGITGSKSSACELDTTEILLESVYFTPEVVSAAGRKLNLHSDSRHRFERGIDPLSCLDGIEMATKLIQEICGGEASEIKKFGDFTEEKIVNFDFESIKSIVGIEISEEKSFKILSDLGFKVIENNKIKVPSHRHDIFANEDLVEEIIRIYGYDQINSENKGLNLNNQDLGLELSTAFDGLSFNHQIRNLLSNAQMNEIISWSFVNSDLAKMFGCFIPELLLANPISSELDILRSNLAIGLISTYSRNVLRGFDNLSLFEIGNVFNIKHESIPMVAGLRAGKNKPIDQFHEERDFDVFDVKQDLLAIAELKGISQKSLQINQQIQANNSTQNPAQTLPSYYHPHRFASVLLGKEIIGYFGEIHPAISKHFGLKNRVNFFEIFTNNFPKNAKKNSESNAKKALKLNDLPMVERDFAFLIDQNFAVGKLIKAVEEADKSMILKVYLFDIYLGEKIPADKKSIALRVEIQPQIETLNSSQIEEISKKVISAVADKCGAQLRSM